MKAIPLQEWLKKEEIDVSQSIPENPEELTAKLYQLQVRMIMRIIIYELIYCKCRNYDERSRMNTLKGYVKGLKFQHQLTAYEDTRLEYI